MIHVQVRKINCVSLFKLREKKGRERPQIKLDEVVKKDMSIKEVTKSMVLDIIEWRKRIYVVDHC